MAANSRHYLGSYSRNASPGYNKAMITELSSPVTPLGASRRKALACALSQAVTPAQLTAARELMQAEAPGRPSPQPEEILYWMRLNMPVATRRVEDILLSNRSKE